MNEINETALVHKKALRDEKRTLEFGNKHRGRSVGMSPPIGMLFLRVTYGLQFMPYHDWV